MDITNRAAYCMFLVAFFMFLLGGEFTTLYFGYAEEYTFTSEINQHTYICLLIALAGLQIGVMAGEKVHKRRSKGCDRPYLERARDHDYDRIRKASKIALYITVIPYYLKVLDIALYVFSNGYLSYYTDYESSLPGVVETLSELFTMFLFIYLATMPKKKECTLPICLYLGCGVLSLLTGRRISFGVNIMVVVVYAIIRHGLAPEEKWITKREVIATLIACPVMMIGLYAYKYIRYDMPVEATGALNMFLGLFSQQGVSIETIKFEKQLEGDSLGCTSLYYTLKYFRSNVLTRNFVNFPLEYYATRSVNTAYETNSLADYIMYCVNQGSYFSGYGLGTSYIAELYHDIGYFGLAVVSIPYGAALYLLYAGQKRSVWGYAIAFMMLEEFVIMPRYSADVIFRPFYNMTKMFIFVVFILLFRTRKGRDIFSKET
jgi:oligosaccharide repeat unit polymerase